MEYKERVERNRVLSACNTKARTALVKAHREEYQALLDKEYAAAGITVRKRLTAEEKRQREIEKARAVLESYGVL